MKKVTKILNTNVATKYAHLPYRFGVGLVLMNSDKKVFVGNRISMRVEAWQFPQGGIDQNENPKEALFRESLEEIGTDNFEIIDQTSDWLAYDLPNDLVPVVWGGQYRGQKQMWFLARFLGDDSEIKIDLHIPEFKEWKWIPFEDSVDHAAPFKIDLYKQITKEFHKHFK